MTGNSSALGKYATIVAAFIVVFVIVADIVFRFVGKTDNQIHDFAILAFGVVLGVGGSLTRLNGTVAKADEHDLRLTAIEKNVLSNTNSIEGVER